MIVAILMMGGLGIIIGSGLAVASKVFYVYVDPLVEQIEELLPGANCGGAAIPGAARTRKQSPKARPHRLPALPGEATLPKPSQLSWE